MRARRVCTSRACADSRPRAARGRSTGCSRIFSTPSPTPPPSPPPRKVARPRRRAARWPGIGSSVWPRPPHGCAAHAPRHTRVILLPQHTAPAPATSPLSMRSPGRCCGAPRARSGARLGECPSCPEDVGYERRRTTRRRSATRVGRIQGEYGRSRARRRRVRGDVAVSPAWPCPWRRPRGSTFACSASAQPVLHRCRGH